MEIKVRNFDADKYVAKFQEGGEMAPPAGDPNAAPGAPEAPQGSGEGDAQQQLMAACQQALDSQDCELAMQVCAALLQMIGGAPAGPAAPEGQPVFKRGGKLSRWIPRN